MTTLEVANRLVSLCREGKIEEAQKELFSSDAESFEPDNTMGTQHVKGLDAIFEKGKRFNSMLEEFHGATISDPVIAGHWFSIAWTLDATMKGRGRQKMEEICVYKVKDGKIISEQFIW
jgi:hypothetical protein